MKPRSAFLMILSSTLVSSFAFSQNAGPVNYLNVAGPISFDNDAYSLAWSAHPTASYYKQEYVKKGETVEKFNTMILVELLTGNMSPKELVSAKVAELKTMQTSNPYVQFETMYNQELQEYILDFLVTANSPDGKVINIAERNVYRYKTYTDKNGKKGVLLFALSSRSYGKEVTKFLNSLKGNRMDMVNKVRLFTIPSVAVK
jgi:hypothetical protein